MPGIGLGEPVGSVEQTEAGDHRQAELVALLDRIFEGRVVMRPVRLLQQVQDIGPVLSRCDIVEDPKPLFVDRHGLASSL